MLILKMQRYRLIAYIISLLIHIIIVVVFLLNIQNFRPKPVQLSNQNIIPVQPIEMPPSTNPPTYMPSIQNITPVPPSSKPTVKPLTTPSKTSSPSTSPTKVAAKPTPKSTPSATKTSIPTQAPSLTPSPTPTLDAQLAELRRYEYFSKWDDTKLKDLKKQIDNNEIPGVKSIDEYIKLTQQLDQSYDWTKVPPRTGEELPVLAQTTTPIPRPSWRETQIDDSSGRIIFQSENTFFIINWTNGNEQAHVTYYQIAYSPTETPENSPSPTLSPTPSTSNSLSITDSIKSFDISFDPDREKFIDAILKKYQEEMIKVGKNEVKPSTK